MIILVFFLKQRTAYEFCYGLVGSEMCIGNRRYPEDFKIEAVKQVVDRGHSASSVATLRHAEA
ncbi:hypothetical protein C7U83_25380 [Escherichia coli]|nr:hypothetical protein C7U83_25380 [Escherichia coli]